MRIGQGAGVYTSEGEKIGEVERVVLDPRSNEVTHVVVEKGFLLTTDKVVPVSLIGPIVDDEVTLREDAGDLEQLPDFVEEEYVLLADERARVAAEGSEARPMYWYPPLAASWWSTGWFQGYALPVYVVRTDKHIPEGAVAIKEGTDVVTVDGEHVGDVEAVLTDAQTDRATHFVISQGLLLKERKLVPTPWISRVGPDAVHLAVDSDLVDGLPEYEG